jgi:DNA repair exonuclease SbcCD ATPase subunit
MLELIVPETQKYLIYAASKNVDIFDQDFIQRVTSGAMQLDDVPEDERWKHQIVKDMMMDEVKLEGFTKYQNEIRGQKENYDKLMMRLYQTKLELRDQAKEMEDTLDRLRGLFNPQQLAKILLTIERNKFRKEITLETVESFWNLVPSLAKVEIYDRVAASLQTQTTFPNLAGRLEMISWFVVTETFIMVQCKSPCHRKALTVSLNQHAEVAISNYS